jgi:hypothetical protein
MAMPGSVKYPGCGVSVMTLELGALGGSWAKVFPAMAPSTPAKNVMAGIFRFKKRAFMHKRLTLAARILLESTDAPPSHMPSD